jgi:hypothetical protein
MTDAKTQPNMNDRPEQAKPQQVGRQAQQSQVSGTAQPAQRVSPGRRPLFRTEVVRGRN